MAKEFKVVKVESIRPRLLSLEDAAKYLGLSVRTVRNRTGPRAKDPFPFKTRKFGRKVLIEVADLDRYIDTL